MVVWVIKNNMKKILSLKNSRFFVYRYATQSEAVSKKYMKIWINEKNSFILDYIYLM